MATNVHEEILNIVCRQYEIRGLADEPFNVNKTLRDNGIDSILFIKIIVDIENKYDIEFDDDFLEMEHVPTLTELVKHTEDKIAEKTAS